MPARSKAQQKAAGAALSARRGKQARAAAMTGSGVAVAVSTMSTAGYQVTVDVPAAAAVLSMVRRVVTAQAPR